MNERSHPAQVMRWGMAPKLTLGSSDRLSAAVWDWSGDAVIDVTAPAMGDMHILSVCVAGRSRAEVFKNGRHDFTKLMVPTSSQIMFAGTVPRAVLCGPGRLVHLYIPQQIITNIVREFPLCFQEDIVDRRHATDPSLGAIAQSVLAEARAPDCASVLFLDTLGLQIGLHLLRRWSRTANGREVAAGGLAPWQLRRATRCLADNLKDDIPLEVLARETGLSPFHFARAFKASVGLPPHQHLIQLRLKRAQELLQATNLPVTEIAGQVGYEDPGYLARLFRKHLGTTPAAYRRERRS